MKPFLCLSFQLLSCTEVNNSHSNHVADSNTGSDTILDAEFAGNNTPSIDRKMTSIEQLEQLERLDSLVDKGRITEEEYRVLKRNLFGS